MARKEGEIMTVYALTRTSNPDSTNSPEVQRDIILQKCAELNIVDPVILDEPLGTSGVSTKFRDRPMGRKLLLESRKGDTIIVCKINRLGRKTSDIIQTIEKFNKRGVRVIVIDFLNGMPMDTITPMGRVLLAVVAAFAEFEANSIRERMLEAKNSLKERGLLAGRSTWHTLVIPNPEGKGKRPIPNSEGIKIVAEIAKRYSKGETYPAIAADLWQRGVKDHRGILWGKIIPKDGISNPTNPYEHFMDWTAQFHRRKRQGLLPKPWCDIAKTIPEHARFNAIPKKRMKRKKVVIESERDGWSVEQWRTAFEAGLLD